MKFHGGSVPQNRGYRDWEGCVSLFRFVHHFTELADRPRSASHSTGGQVRKVLSLLTKMYAGWQADDTSAPVKSAAAGREAGCIDSWGWGPSPATASMNDGVRGSPFLLLSLVPWKINFLLEPHGHQRRNEIALKWRQKTFTFIRHDYGCSMVSLLLLWRNLIGSLPLSLNVPAFLLLFIWTSSPPLSLDTSLPGGWFYFCPLLQAIQSAYCVCTDSPVRDTYLPHTVKYHSMRVFVFFFQRNVPF